MISRFFIDRPIFATVLSVLITLAGAVAVIALPIAQYPDITPPTVQVSAIYPGANAELVRDTVAAPIEQQISGVENLMYMSSQCTNDGSYNLMLTFKPGTDLNIAQVLVQVRVSLAQPILPDVVQREGVSVLKKSPSVMMIVNFISPDHTRDALYLSNYATIQIRDELLRLPGVGDVTFLGQRNYSMRAWLNPEALATRNLTADDVLDALQNQNIQVAAGNIGQQPAPRGQEFQLTMSALGRLTTPEQFGDVVLKVTQGGKDGQVANVVRLRDVATLDLGAQSYDQTCTLDGEPSVALSIYQLPGSNAIATAGQVYKKMDELKQRFPEGVEFHIVYDTTPFIKESIVEVLKTLRDAIILVAIVVLVFLQNWRATLIPLVAVPVAVVGTFAVMALFGFSLNNLSLFGLVLAIGIVVDDAIVVVENVERWMAQGLPPRDAAVRAMDEVTGPVIAVALVLCAVFVPCAFITGITGQFFRQFALTIAASTVISAFNSLTLSPALAALLLKPHTEQTRRQGDKETGRQRPLPRVAFVLLGGLLSWYLLEAWLAQLLESWKQISPLLVSLSPCLLVFLGAVAGWLLDEALNRGLGWFFKIFNRSFDLSTGIYTRAVALLLRGSLIALLIYGGLLVLTGWQFDRVPTGFIPQQDKGYLLLNVQLPDAASVQRTEAVMSRIEKMALNTEGVSNTVSISGQSLILGANASNFGSMYVMLKPFHERHGRDSDVIAGELRERFAAEIRDTLVGVFGAPPVDGLGTVGGFKLMIEDRASHPLPELQRVADDIVQQGNETPGLQDLFTSLRADTPWIYLDIDRVKARSLNVSLKDVFDTLQIYFGSYYVNNFNEFGRSWQVNIQAAPSFRANIPKLLQLKVRNSKGQMLPLATIAKVRDIGGPVLLMRYNMYQAAAINGDTAPGTSSGQGITLMQQVAQRNLEPGMTTDWTELAYLQVAAGSTAMILFVLAVVLVFLVLAAQYESWALPLAVILVVPMCLLCSITGVALAGRDMNIFTQIGFVVLVGLASKNAILIVEFAKQKREGGTDRREAALEACRLRLRPILMTSFAFILGVVPLVIAEGAGAEMRRALGLAVFSGMLGVTLFGIFLTPVFYFVVEWFAERGGKNTGPVAEKSEHITAVLPGN